MSTVAGALATAGLLGVTHALEPDHVAGISSLTSEYGDSRLSALVGACFSVGHIALVAAWLVIAYLVLGQTEFPPIMEAVGTLGVGILLGVFGAAMAVSGLRRIIRVDEHDHGEETHSHLHVHLPLPGFDSHDHGHDTVSYLKTGLVGALFTLSPPVSMILFSSTLLPDYGVAVIAMAVVAYGLTITVTMSLLGAGAGALFGLSQQRSGRTYGIVKTVAGTAIVGLAVSLLVETAGVLL
jgi:hypothetical protein